MKLKIYQSFSDYNTKGRFTFVPSHMNTTFFDTSEEHIFLIEVEVTPVSESILRQLGAKEIDKQIAEKYLEVERLKEKKQQLLCLENLQ